MSFDTVAVIGGGPGGLRAAHGIAEIGGTGGLAPCGKFGGHRLQCRDRHRLDRQQGQYRARQAPPAHPFGIIDGLKLRKDILQPVPQPFSRPAPHV